jgi:hypothetical protein
MLAELCYQVILCLNIMRIPKKFEIKTTNSVLKIPTEQLPELVCIGHSFYFGSRSSLPVNSKLCYTVTFYSSFLTVSQLKNSMIFEKLNYLKIS